MLIFVDPKLVFGMLLLSVVALGATACFQLVTPVPVANLASVPVMGRSPVFAQNVVGFSHTVWVTIGMADDARVEGMRVRFEVVSGPNSGVVSDPNSGECWPNEDCTTDQGGKVSWSYRGMGGPGTDEIQICLNTGGGKVCSDVAIAHWFLPPPRPADAEKFVGEDHAVWAELPEKWYGPPVGVPVIFRVVAGPNSGEVSGPDTGECEPNDCAIGEDGRVWWTYRGIGGPGMDEIEACFDIEHSRLKDGQVIEEPACSALALVEWTLPGEAGTKP